MYLTNFNLISQYFSEYRICNCREYSYMCMISFQFEDGISIYNPLLNHDKKSMIVSDVCEAKCESRNDCWLAAV